MYFLNQFIQLILSDNFRLSLASENEYLLTVGFAFLRRDSAIQASLMAFAAPSVAKDVYRSLQIQLVLFSCGARFFERKSNHKLHHLANAS